MPTPTRKLIPIGLVLAGLSAADARAQSLEQPLVPVPFTQVGLSDPFFAPRIATNRAVVIEACLAKCAETGRIANFAVAAGHEPGVHRGALYNDSDVYKVLEGIAYALASKRDPALEARADRIIDEIAAAQMDDGYLDTYFQLVQPANRWKNIAWGHELYCAGHLMEAAVAYAQATGKQKLLDVAKRLAACIEREFGPGKRLDPPGHPEIELALVKLARYTKDPRHAEMARFFVDQRGSTKERTSFGAYAQDDKPLREQTEIVGHAVRAMYLYSGAADVAGWFHDESLLDPLFTIWRDLVETKLYVTGGIGSSAANEGFTRPYDLPNESAYSETCAAIGMLLWNQRMFLDTGKTCFVDLYERELYNAIPSGLSYSGAEFFYDNPLASHGQHARVPWFDCSCCPTNLVRTLPSVGQYAYATGPHALYVLLFAQNKSEVVIDGTKVGVEMKSEMPWKGRVEITFAPERPTRFSVWLRVPNWAVGHSVVPPPLPAGVKIDDSIFPKEINANGAHWRVLEREWKRGDVLAYDMGMETKRIHADPKVEADVGRVALQRGPLIYAFEGRDNGGRALDIVVPPEVDVVSNAWRPELFSGTVVLTPHGERVRDSDPFVAVSEPADFVALPYCLWANRGAGEMAVWVAEEARYAERPGEGARLARGPGALLRASRCFASDTLAALDDGVLGKDSGDGAVPRMTFWPARGSTQWIEVDTKEPRTLDGCAVQWFDDGARGACRVPRSWRALYRDGADWKPVSLVSSTSNAEGSPDATPGYGVAKDALQSIRFAPVATRALRLEIGLQPEFSAGVLEWRVDAAR